MTSWTDPEAVACNGPTLSDLREASVDRMLEPYRQQVSEMGAQVVEQIEELEAIVRDLAAASPYDNRGGGDCVFCSIDLYFCGSDPTGHLRECPWRRAKELTQRDESAADPRAETQ